MHRPHVRQRFKQLLCWCLLSVLLIQTIGLVHKIAHRVSHQVAAEVHVLSMRTQIASDDKPAAMRGLQWDWGHAKGSVECLWLDHLMGDSPLGFLLPALSVVLVGWSRQGSPDTPTPINMMWRRGARGPPAWA